MKKILLTLATVTLATVFWIVNSASAGTVSTTASVDGENRVITITMTALQAKGDALADDAARFYYEIKWKNDDQFKTDNEGVLEITPYDSLTNAQKLNILGLETKYNLLLGAKAYYKKSVVEPVVTSADADIDTRY